MVEEGPPHSLEAAPRAFLQTQRQGQRVRMSPQTASPKFN